MLSKTQIALASILFMLLAVFIKTNNKSKFDNKVVDISLNQRLIYMVALENITAMFLFLLSLITLVTQSDWLFKVCTMFVLVATFLEFRINNTGIRRVVQPIHVEPANVDPTKTTLGEYYY